MKILLIVLGVLMSLCGVSLATTPLLTFWETNYFFIVLLIVYGFSAILRGFAKKKYGAGFLVGLVSLIAGLVLLFVPGLKFITSTTIVYMMAVWFLIQAALSITLSLRAKKAGAATGDWLWNLIMGILCVVLGIYSLCHPMALAFSMGMLIGVYFIVTGINMLVLAIQLKKIEVSE